MSKTTVLDNDYVTMWFHPEKKIVHHQFHKFIYGEPLRDTLMAGTRLLEKHQAQKWLSDDRNNAVLPEEDRNWGNANWFPQTIKAGWKYWALILPEKVVGQMSMKQLVDDYSKRGLSVRIFSNPDEGLKWLESL